MNQANYDRAERIIALTHQTGSFMEGVRRYEEELKGQKTREELDKVMRQMEQFHGQTPEVRAWKTQKLAELEQLSGEDIRHE